MGNLNRCNLERTDFGMAVCFGDHERSEDCEWEYLYWADDYLEQKRRITELETQLNKRDRVIARIRELPEKWRKNPDNWMENVENLMSARDCADRLDEILRAGEDDV